MDQTFVRTITLPGEGIDRVITAAELLGNGVPADARERRLATGGDPDADAAPPADDAFKAYFDTDGTPLDWDPSEWEDDEDLKPEIVELEFAEAPDIERVALALIGSCHEFERTRKLKIVYRWKRKGGRTHRGSKISGSTKLTGLLHDTLHADYLVWVAADHVRARKLDAWKLEAVVYHELCHLGPDRLQPHEFEGFSGELVRYGPVRYELQVALNAVERWQKPQQLMLNGVDA